MIDATLEIRRLNDSFRRSLSGGGKRLMTAGIAALPPQDQAAILAKVMAFDAFTEDNDPHGEHDFGAFDHAGHRIFWKIDYLRSVARIRLGKPGRSSQDDARADDHARRGILSRRSRRTSAPAGISLPWDAMSIKRMNIDEKARYLIGEAIMRRILKSERTPDDLVVRT